MAKGLVIHRSDEGQRDDDYNSRSVSFDGVEFGTVDRFGRLSGRDYVVFLGPTTSMIMEMILPRKLRGIKCEKKYDNLWQIRAELAEIIRLGPDARG